MPGWFTQKGQDMKKSIDSIVSITGVLYQVQIELSIASLGLLMGDYPQLFEHPHKPKKAPKQARRTRAKATQLPR